MELHKSILNKKTENAGNPGNPDNPGNPQISGLELEGNCKPAIRIDRA